MKLFVFLFVILLILNFVSSSKYAFVNQRKTWYDANKYCQQRYGSTLAIITNSYDNHLASQACKAHECWFGANDQSREHKFKYPNGQRVVYTNWAAHEPNNLGNEDCVEIRGNGQWNDNNCHHKRTFICNNNPKPTGYIRGPAPMTYFDAYWYCKLKGTSLATIRNSNENYNANAICNGGNCWIGYNDIGNEGHFIWLFGSSHYTNWQPHEPNNLHSEHCVQLISHNQKWNDNDCYNKYIPLCNANGFSAKTDSLINEIESKVNNDFDNKLITNGIYLNNINITNFIIFVFAIIFAIFFIALILKSLVDYTQSNRK